MDVEATAPVAPAAAATAAAAAEAEEEEDRCSICLIDTVPYKYLTGSSSTLFFDSVSFSYYNTS